MLLWLAIMGLVYAGPKSDGPRAEARRERALKLEEVAPEPVVAEATRELVREKRHEAIAMLEAIVAADDETLPLFEVTAARP